MPPTSTGSPLEGSTGSHHWSSSAIEEASNGYASHGDMVAAAAATAAAIAANGGSRYGYNMAGEEFDKHFLIFVLNQTLL